MEDEEKKRKKEREVKEAEEKKELKKRAQERRVHEEWQYTLDTLALKIGKESGINHLHRVILGFRMRETDVTSGEWELLRAAERAMNELTPNPNYSTTPPPIPQEIPKPFNYQAPWWKKYSEWYRNEKRWTCEECELDFTYDRYYLQTHHILGTQYNSPEYLRVLCLGCHAEQLTPPGHHRLKEGSNYTEFITKYGEQWKKALNTFKDLSLQFAVELAKASINQGVTEGQLDQHKDAIKDFNTAIRLKPDYATAYCNRGIAKVKMGQYKEAIADFDTAIRLKPDSVVLAHYNRALTMKKLQTGTTK